MTDFPLPPRIVATDRAGADSGAPPHAGPEATAPATPMITLVELAQWSRGDLVVKHVPEGAVAREEFLRSGVTGASLDSRAIAPGMLFVPLPGRKVDGHAFLDEVFARGAGAALCARAVHPLIAHHDLGPLVLVDDVTVALQSIATEYRKRWPGLMVGVTGSAGKTTTKELVAAAFATEAPTLRTLGNKNNHWGVPLTILGLERRHQVAIVEMGMNAPGEIAALAAIAGPNAAIVTNAGSAHLEGLGSLEGVAREKASLVHALPKGAPAFVGADSPLLLEAVKGAKAEVITYGFAKGAAVRPRVHEELGAAGSRLEVDGFPPLHLQLVGRHMAANALAALAVAKRWKLDPERVVAALAAYAPMGGRMEVKRARGATLLVDCYNANPDSMAAALASLASWPGAVRRIALLGDMRELGETAARLHEETGEKVRGAELWTVGAHAGDYARGAARAGVAARVFDDKPAAAAALREALAEGVVVLLKGSRGAALEHVLEGLDMES
ncbi:MAG: UDP-N-acetylmuramoyl-tripeptide--D-alanyl-D-alanine ligase [Candidatus Eisenbacteria bacterium]|uniref:UDP-N-acetylmuramoyl-tripeptide--D-alanyl-D-alanine ligase n=1 Tax=Eiseniibacteriota bacterium TaxID=2212470 RepID=A0A933SDZ2_UNCEI|nr:UDP-N-acetylmuramoyl-tripeptide--D-alanyl-D-alanine ligase [Candidatus Eisenbacteria bacterium]